MATSRELPVLTVSIVAVPEIASGVMASLYEVLSFVGIGWEAMTGWPSGQRRFAPRIVAADRQPFRNPAGLPITPEATFAEDAPSDIVIVGDLVVLRGDETRGRWPEAAAWLRRQHERGALICSVCTGSLLLAESGLLDGEEATCHWASVEHMRACYPAVRLRPERVLAPAGPEHRLVTAGAAASWSDLVLYLVARFCGEDEARRTAKLFLFGDRSAGQQPFAARVRPRQHDDAAVAAAQLWIADHYAAPNPVAGMAREAGLVGRTFHRRFAAATGYAPLDYVQSLRIEEAKQMLESGDAAIDAIAAEVGYGEPAAFRRVFRRGTGLSPLQYRQRFRTAVGQTAAPATTLPKRGESRPG